MLRQTNLWGLAPILGATALMAVLALLDPSPLKLVLAYGSATMSLIPFFAQKFVDRRFERLAEEAGYQDRHITPLPWMYRMEMLLMGLFRPYRHAAILLYTSDRMLMYKRKMIREVRGIPFDRAFGGRCVGLLYELRCAGRSSRTPFREVLAAYTDAAELYGPEAVLAYIRVGRSPMVGLEYLERGISPEYAIAVSR